MAKSLDTIQQEWQNIYDQTKAGNNTHQIVGAAGKDIVEYIKANPPLNLAGWSPIFAVVADGQREVLQLQSWTGGTGTPPNGAGQYLGATGLVANISQGVNIKGTSGEVMRPVSKYSIQQSIYIFMYNSAGSDALFDIVYYPVIEGKTYNIKGQVSSPFSNNPTGIGAFAFYTNNLYAKGIEGAVTRQPSNVTTHPVVNYDTSLIAPTGAVYLGVTQMRGVDSVVISGIIAESKKITVWGDSITWGSASSSVDTCYTAILRNKIKASGIKDFAVINCGVGGESFQNIPVRQGGLGFYIANDIILPAQSTSKVEIQRIVNWINNKKLRNTYHADNSYFSLLLQGETGRDNTGEVFKTVNPIIVNGIECTMTITGNSENGVCYLNRNVSSSTDTLIKAGSFLYPHGATFQQEIIILSLGTNGGFFVTNSGVVDLQASINQFIDIINLMIEKSNTNKYIICSPYAGTALQTIGVNGLIELENSLTKRYGSRFFNWRKYLNESGLTDAGLTPTTADNIAIAEGKVPPSLLSDGLHPNDFGHNVIGLRIFNILNSMGWLIS